MHPSQTQSNQKWNFDHKEGNPKRLAYVKLKCELPLAKEAVENDPIQPSPTKSNQIKPAGVQACGSEKEALR
jgi:hypothetical protein